MQDSFTSPSGFISVSYPDVLVRRPRVPFVMERTQFVALLTDADIKMGWLGNYPSFTARHIAAHPERLGVMTGPLVYPAAAPISWMPTLLSFLAAPRLYRTFYSYKADPLSGYDLDVAQKMAWDPTRKTPLSLRAKPSFSSFAYVPSPTVVISTGVGCVEMDDTSFSVPLLLAQVLTVSDLIAEILTHSDLINEDLC